MDFQIIIVGAIVVAALTYVGCIFWRKIKSFSSESKCEINCGCEGKFEKGR